MQGREFLDLARELAAGTTEKHWRAAVIHAYYALFLECRDALVRWGRPPPPRFNVHSAVRLAFDGASDADLRRIGQALERLGRRRNEASYDLPTLPIFASDVEARVQVQRATTALALLDQIEADPARLASAIASLPP